MIRYAALLRGTESAWQAVAYGLESVTVFAEFGGIYMNFGLWALSIFPAWLVLRHFGAFKGPDDASSEVSQVGPSKLASGSSSEDDVAAVSPGKEL